MRITKNNFIIISLFLIFCELFYLGAVDYKNTARKEIETSPAVYLKRSSDIWAKQSRIAGEIKNAPKAFSIEIYNVATSKLLRTDSPDTNISVYETGWIPAGTYEVVIKSEGYVEHKIKNLKIKPFTDCVINISFGTRIYYG